MEKTCHKEATLLLMEELEKNGLPLQSHLSENLSEIEWVKELQPGASCYGDAYRMFGLFGDACPTVMAHAPAKRYSEADYLDQNAEIKAKYVKGKRVKGR